MAYETGTAQNERDLLDKLNAFLTSSPALTANGQNWETIFDRRLPATVTTAEVRQIVWRSSGTGIEQDIYIGAMTYNNITADIYNVKFLGGTYFNAGLVTADSITPGFTNPSPPVTLFFDARACDYGIVASGRRAVIYTRITNTNICSSAYLGFILPTVTPLEYAYPLCIAGSSALDIRYSTESSQSSSIVHALNRNCWLLTPDQAWSIFGGGGHSNGDAGYYQLLYPTAESSGSYAQLGKINGVPMPLYPVEFISTGGARGVNRWGAMDGVYWIPGVQRAIFDTVGYDGKTGIIINNSYRTTVMDYLVIEVDDGI